MEKYKLSEKRYFLVEDLWIAAGEHVYRKGHTYRVILKEDDIYENFELARYLEEFDYTPIVLDGDDHFQLIGTELLYNSETNQDLY